MINNTIYKACLFLSVGSVEYRAKTTDLERLGGLGNKMPLTFLSFLVAALAISGVPPLNGFYSKWMVYQGVVKLSNETGFWPIFLVAAMFGSVLTLASFLKMIHSIFLGSRPKELDGAKETHFDITVPSLILALFCIIFGIFAAQIPLKYLILPSLPFATEGSGYWSPIVAMILIMLALVIGAVIFLLGTALKPKKGMIFVGGEIMEDEESRIPGTEFYSSVKYLPFLSKLYESGTSGLFDLYNISAKFAEGLASIVFKYVDRVIDQVYSVIGEVLRFVSSILRPLIIWCLAMLTIPLLIYGATGLLASLQVFALMLLIIGPLIAITEDNLNRFLLTVTAGQLGLVLLSLGYSPAISLFQMSNSIVGLLLIILGIKTAINLNGGTQVQVQVQDMSGLANKASVVTVGFVVGGLMLSGLPPTPNFISKFMTVSLFEDSATISYMVGFGSLLNLVAFLRVIRRIFSSPVALKFQKRFGSEDLLVIILLIVAIIFTCCTNNIIEFFESFGGSG